MNLRTGVPGPTVVHRRNGGFTLIEIMIALAIVALTMGLVIVSVEGITPVERVRSAARKIAGTSDFVRSQATGSRLRCFLDIDFKNNRYRYRREPLLDPQGRHVDAEDGRVLSPEEIEEWHAGFAWDDLPRGVFFNRLVYSPTMFYGDGEVTVTYWPNGTLNTFILHLQGAVSSEDDEGTFYSVVVNGLTGKAEVLEGAASFPKATEPDFSQVMGSDAPGNDR